MVVRIGDWMREILMARLDVWGITGRSAELIVQAVLALIVLAVSFVVNYVVKKLLRPRIDAWIDESSTTWDNALKDRRVVLRLSHLAPALVIYVAAAWFPGVEAWILRVSLAYMAVVGLLVIAGLLDSIRSLRSETADDRGPIEGYMQAGKIVLFVVGAVVIPATLMGESPWKLLTGFGALTAIVLLIFRESILGLVASIQIHSNNIVRVGDWIEMPKFGADGDVQEISLHTVKVRNWDKTITTIPTTALVSGSLKNWEGMRNTGGRRIKRCIHIDMNSVKFCTAEMLARFRTFAYLEEYIDARLADIDVANREQGFDMSVPVSGRRLTNIGTFRAYILEYLRHHPHLHSEDDMTLLVRHRDPTEHGLPIEIYVFTNDVAWAVYEGVQSDIFDHILAVIPLFELRVYQAPTGMDVLDGVTALASRP